MIVPESTGWLRTLFYWNGTTLKKTWPRVALVTAVASVVTYLHDAHGFFEENMALAPFTLVGLALSIFLGFRNNSSYDRFWEGRKLWGALVNQSRSTARQIVTLVRPPPGAMSPLPREELDALHRKLVLQVAGYVHALRLHLRGQSDLSDLEPFFEPNVLDSLEREHNRPVAILKLLGRQLRDAWDQELVHPFHVPLLEQSLERLTDIQGGCERIRATPIPYSYTVLIHRIVAIYCFGLPFGLVEDINLLTPLIVAFVAYAFFGLDTLGDEIEEPFGFDPSDLPLGQLSRMIEVNLRQTLDEPLDQLPPLKTPVGDILS